ncbi:hypothetical protein ANN_11700 [Periplaneta americana]|uniref:Mariner Mos1 transposase n=1 Tax=Periplaneta americana TaxID=6978 RepID=A0ABQ8T783_PERAM|nr:hypothetical protein ANN_11700 [Periplaneta americana]
MAGLCEGGNETSGSLKAICKYTLALIRQAYGEEAMSRTPMYEWHKRFTSGRLSTDVYLRSGRPRSARTEEMIARIAQEIRRDRRQSIDYVLLYLAPADFYLFPKVKSLFMGRRFASAGEVKIHATQVVQEVTKDELQKCLEKWYGRWQKCVTARREYFEGRVVKSKANKVYTTDNGRGQPKLSAFEISLNEPEYVSQAGNTDGRNADQTMLLGRAGDRKGHETA